MSDIRFNICGECPPFYAQLYCEDQTTILSSKSIDYSSNTFNGSYGNSFSAFCFLDQNTTYYIKVIDCVGKEILSAPIITPADYPAYRKPIKTICLCGVASLSEDCTCSILNANNTSNIVYVDPPLENYEWIKFDITSTKTVNNTEQSLQIQYSPNGDPINITTCEWKDECFDHCINVPTFTMYCSDKIYYNMFVRCKPSQTPVYSCGSFNLNIENITSSENIEVIVGKPEVGINFEYTPPENTTTTTTTTTSNIPTTTTKKPATICFCTDPNDVHKKIGISAYATCGRITTATHESLNNGESVYVEIEVLLTDINKFNCSEGGCLASYTSSCFSVSREGMFLPFEICHISNTTSNKYTTGVVCFTLLPNDTVSYCAYTDVFNVNESGEASVYANICYVNGNNVNAIIAPDTSKNTICESIIYT